MRTNAISLTSADNTLIADNRLTYASERGRGVIVEFDSDDNEISGNTVVSTDAASTGLVQQVPGGPYAVGQLAILDNEIHCLLGDRSLRNVVVDGDLIQVTAANGTRDPRPSEASIEDSARPDHNIIEGNTIVDLGRGNSCTLEPDVECRTDLDCPAAKGPCVVKQNSGIGFNVRAGETIVRGNVLSGRMDRGLSMGGVVAPMTLPRWYPGTCSADPEQDRMCLDDADCNISGLPALGSCSGVGPITFNGNSIGLSGEGNSLDGRFDNAALFANNTVGFILRGNVVEGGTETLTGMNIMPTALGIAERNVVNGTANAILIGRPGAVPYSIRLNDFSGYATAIRTTDNLTVSTTLGGNYWGAACPGLDPAKVRFTNGLVNPNVSDVSYGVPVASTADALLPPPCE